MDKRVYLKVWERANGRCEYCGRYGDLQLHHILRRLPKETVDNCCMLCVDCHEELHHGKNGHQIDLDLKRMLQATYEKQGYSIEEIRKLMGGRTY